MGFAFGIMQMIVFHFLPSRWMLPVFGGVVGSVTNWVALLMIFKPTWPIHSMLLLRHLHTAGSLSEAPTASGRGYARMTTRDVISTRAMLKLLRGPSSNRLLEIAHKHVKPAIDLSWANGAALRKCCWAQTSTKISAGRWRQGYRLHRGDVGHAEGYFEEAMDLERTLHVKMSALPPDEFEALLRPVFSEDEWKLIARWFPWCGDWCG